MVALVLPASAMLVPASRMITPTEEVAWGLNGLMCPIR